MGLVAAQGECGRARRVGSGECVRAWCVSAPRGGWIRYPEECITMLELLCSCATPRNALAVDSPGGGLRQMVVVRATSHNWSLERAVSTASPF